MSCDYGEGFSRILLKNFVFSRQSKFWLTLEEQRTQWEAKTHLLKPFSHQKNNDSDADYKTLREKIREFAMI